MDEGLPVHKIANYFKNNTIAAKQALLDKYSFCEFMRKEVSKPAL